MNHKMSVEEILSNTFTKHGTITESDKELLPVYNINREILGVAPRLLCHKLGLIHKVVYLLIIDNNGRLLLQTRGDGRLDIAVGGHVSSLDSSDLQAVLREAKEELFLSININNIFFVGSYFRDYSFSPKKPDQINREIRELYCLFVDEYSVKRIEKDFVNRIEQQNVKATSWFQIQEVMETCNKGNAADGLRSSLEYYMRFLKKKHN